MIEIVVLEPKFTYRCNDPSCLTKIREELTEVRRRSPLSSRSSATSVRSMPAEPARWSRRRRHPICRSSRDGQAQTSSPRSP